MLDKRLKLGGLQVGGPRTAQNPARFRVANNVYQTRDEYMVPRFHNEEELALGSGKEVVSLSSYTKQPFAVVRDAATSKMEFYANSTSKIPTYNIAASDFTAPGEADSSGPQYIEKFGCLFVHFPYYGLYKYDGTQAYKAGVPLPYFDSAQINPAGAAYIRVIQHHIDFQGNIVNSGYVEFRATPSANLVNIQTDSAASEICGNAEVYPKVRTSKLDGNYDQHFWVSTGAPTVNAGPRTVTCPTGGNHNVVVGAYVLITASGLISASLSGFTIDTKAIAVKVVSFTGTEVVFSLDNVKIQDASGNWVVEPMATTYPGLAFAVHGTNHWMSGWTSNVATGNYVLRGVWRAFYDSNTTQTFALDCTSLTSPNNSFVDSTAFNLSGNLGDIYDVTTVKDVFPYYSVYNGVNLPKAFTTYGELALVADNNIIYFSDTSLGGSFEMVNGLSFAVVGEGTDGDIQTVCGNFDFFLVSRQSKNYYVAGNLPTANYRVQPITNTSMGAHSNESCIPYEDKIMFLNAQGVWALYSGGRCEEISININGLFKNFSETTQFSEELFFDMSAYENFVSYFNYPDQWVRVRSDVARGLVTFLIKGDGTGTALVLNMNNGEFYTWNGFAQDHGFTTPKVKDLTFINGEYYIALNYPDGGNYHGNVYKEVKTGGGQYNYVPSSYPIRLDTTWFNAGEPSLEKKLQQIKLWGVVTGAVSVSHYLDWNDSEINDLAYSNTSLTLFSHKHRLKSANFLAVSVSLDVVPDSGRFELEGTEIEFESLQEGMKR